MIEKIAQIHVSALPKTFSSRRGKGFVKWLYHLVNLFGYVKVVEKNHEIVGVISGIHKLILTLVVDPVWQRKGIGSELLGMIHGKQYVYTSSNSVEFYGRRGFEKIFEIGKTIFLCRKK